MLNTSLLKPFLVLVLAATLISCQERPEANFTPQWSGRQIAFLADVHLQDVYGTFTDSDFRGLKDPESGQYATIRTMQAQLHSTRLFNENYFAFIAALDDIVQRGIKYVVLPGDFSDDGQPLNVRGIKRILDDYSQNHGISFIVTTGNHDPCHPYDREAGKSDFLGADGKQQPIMSRAGLYSPDLTKEHPVVVTRDIRKLGYGEIITLLGDHGFFPKPQHLYWETPFSSYDYQSYSLEQARQASQLDKRTYSILPDTLSMPDISYLVEPEEGLWFVAIDANVYIPRDNALSDPLNPTSYNSPSIGYRNMLTHKRHLITWIEGVTQRAEALGKVVIAFSHYPMIEFNDKATPNIQRLLGENGMQSLRVPPQKVADLFADAGLKVHFGGHMHINDTGVHESDAGNTLINVQIPSLAAYIPAYKLLTLHDQYQWEVETIVVDSVPDFNTFFDLYQMEYDFLVRTGQEMLWNKNVLQSQTYKDYTSFHLKELVRLRFLPNEWPEALKEFFLPKTGEELLLWAFPDASVQSISPARQMEEATKGAMETARRNNIAFSNLSQWKGSDLVYDLYRLRSADRLAIPDITQRRIQEYTAVLEAIAQSQARSGQIMTQNIEELQTIFYRFLNGAPAGHFILNRSNGLIQAIPDPKANQTDGE